jgi:hypothetical protein
MKNGNLMAIEQHSSLAGDEQSSRPLIRLK